MKQDQEKEQEQEVLRKEVRLVVVLKGMRWVSEMSWRGEMPVQREGQMMKKMSAKQKAWKSKRGSKALGEVEMEKQRRTKVVLRGLPTETGTS